MIRAALGDLVGYGLWAAIGLFYRACEIAIVVLFTWLLLSTG
jgi:hypothetical protein